MLTKPFEKFKLKIVYPKYSGYWQKSKNIRNFLDINKLGAMPILINIEMRYETGERI